MKKIKLITSLSSLAIIGTAVPIVATSCSCSKATPEIPVVKCTSAKIGGQTASSLVSGTTLDEYLVDGDTMSFILDNVTGAQPTWSISTEIESGVVFDTTKASPTTLRFNDVSKVLADTTYTVQAMNGTTPYTFTFKTKAKAPITLTTAGTVSGSGSGKWVPAKTNDSAGTLYITKEAESGVNVDLQFTLSEALGTGTITDWEVKNVTGTGVSFASNGTSGTLRVDPKRGVPDTATDWTIHYKGTDATVSDFTLTAAKDATAITVNGETTSQSFTTGSASSDMEIGTATFTRYNGDLITGSDGAQWDDETSGQLKITLGNGGSGTATKDVQFTSSECSVIYSSEKNAWVIKVPANMITADKFTESGSVSYKSASIWWKPLVYPTQAEQKNGTVDITVTNS